MRHLNFRHKILDCWSNNCSLFTVNLEGNNSCYNATWWSLIHYNTRLTTTSYQTMNQRDSPVLDGQVANLTALSLVQVLSDIADISLFHHFFIYTSTKGKFMKYNNIYRCGCRCCCCCVFLRCGSGLVSLFVPWCVTFK